MLKFVLVTTLAFVASTMAYVEDHAPNGEIRLCPDGYFYAGEDTERKTKDVWLEEKDRSPTYSCYKVSDKESDYFKATRSCEADKGHLISLEDQEELERVNNKMSDHHTPKDDNTTAEFLTSAIYFSFEKEWHWMGSNSNKSIDPEMLNLTNTTMSGQVSQTMEGSCLTLQDTTFSSADCLEERTYICELRVETVTYFAWFVANWFSLLLVFLVVVLLISLCITTSMFRQRRRETGRVYRASARPVFEDKPPSYNNATGNTAANRYLNRGREFLAKVTISPRQNTDEKA